MKEFLEDYVQSQLQFGSTLFEALPQTFFDVLVCRDASCFFFVPFGKSRMLVGRLISISLCSGSILYIIICSDVRNPLTRHMY